MSKTFTADRLGYVFDWNEFLVNAIINGVDEVTACNARIRAGSWVTCAVGNQCARLPRRDNGAPLDATLSALGMQFYTCVYERNWVIAHKMLRKIEERAAELIAKMRDAKKDT